ncbi:MAG: hypothetical protein R2806_22485 [Saprospiraceae bacterium]
MNADIYGDQNIDNKTDITYLIGAGASFNAIPVVNELTPGLKRFKSFIRKNVKDKNKIKLFENVFNKYLPEIVKCYSVDTYAKKLWLQNEIEEFNRFKLFLSAYFLFEEITEHPATENESSKTILDYRYDSFFATVLEKNKNNLYLPSTLNIISWNYDSQIEKSYSGFSKMDLDDSYKSLGICSYGEIDRLSSGNEFRIFKLNGSARLISKIFGTDNMSNSNFKNLITEEIVLEIIQNLENPLQYWLTLLVFAWEHDYNDIYFENIDQRIKATKVFVIIGYSFPLFNRNIDKLITKELQPTKVVIQAPANDLEGIRSRLLQTVDIDPKIIQLESITDLFYIPNELGLPH